jgi:hypothetical protein
VAAVKVAVVVVGLAVILPAQLQLRPAQRMQLLLAQEAHQVQQQPQIQVFRLHLTQPHLLPMVVAAAVEAVTARRVLQQMGRMVGLVAVAAGMTRLTSARVGLALKAVQAGLGLQRGHIMAAAVAVAIAARERRVMALRGVLEVQALLIALAAQALLMLLVARVAEQLEARGQTQRLIPVTARGQGLILGTLAVRAAPAWLSCRFQAA